MGAGFEIRRLFAIASLAMVTSVWAQITPTFAIDRFKIEGNTVLTQSEIDTVVQPFIGSDRNFGDIQRALDALVDRYRLNGYSTVTVLLPEQVLDRGEVLLKVIEGRVVGVKVSGHQYFDETNIRAALATLRLGEVPNIDAVSANLRIANENPAKKTTLQLQPGNHEGEIEATLHVKDEKPWRIGTTLDNSGTPQTGKRRLGLMAQHGNLWNRDHVLTYQYQTSPDQPNDVEVHALAYRVPLYDRGDALDFYVTRSNVNAGTIAAGPVNLAISGSGTVFGVRYTLNLKRSGSYEQQLMLGIDLKEYRNDISANEIPLGNQISVHPLTVQYNGRWQAERTELALFGSLAHNLPSGSQGRRSDFDRVRSDAPARFTILRVGLNATHATSTDWLVRFAGMLQWTPDPLIPQEYLGIGGSTSVRGFQEREIANDRGFQTSLELYSPELCQPLGGGHGCRVLTFIDSGAVYRVGPLPGEGSQEHVASAGLGVRYTRGKEFLLQADYGQVLQGGGAQKRGDLRLHVRLGLFF